MKGIFNLSVIFLVLLISVLRYIQGDNRLDSNDVIWQPENETSPGEHRTLSSPSSGKFLLFYFLFISLLIFLLFFAAMLSCLCLCVRVFINMKDTTLSHANCYNVKKCSYSILHNMKFPPKRSHIPDHNAFFYTNILSFFLF